MPERAPTGPALAPLRRVAPGVGLTVLAWFIGRVVVGVNSHRGRNPFSFVPLNWMRWDSFNYQAIANHGSTFYACPASSFPAEKLHLHWCGDAAWFPAYPWLMRLGHGLGLSIPSTGVGISWVCLALALFVLWWGWLRDLHWFRALVLMALFSVFPGAVFNYAIFPMSLTLVLVLAGLASAHRGHFVVMALAMGAAGLCYPLVWPGDIGLTAGLVFVAWPQGRRQVARVACYGMGALVLSIVLLSSVYAGQTGYFNAYYLTARQATTPAGRALLLFYRMLVEQKSVEQRRLGPTARAALSLQILMALVVVTISSVAAVARRQAALVYPAAFAIGVVFGVVFASNTAGWSRSVVLTAPAVVGLRRVPLPILVIITAVVALATSIVSRSFFTGELV